MIIAIPLLAAGSFAAIVFYLLKRDAEYEKAFRTQLSDSAPAVRRIRVR